MFAPVYLDHNATTPIDPRVLERMRPWLSEQFGNASSRHEYGRAARRAIDEAREQVAAAVGAHSTEIVFTSGGSEANNLFIKGAAAWHRPGIVAVSAVEHPCVIRPAEQLVRHGWTLRRISVDTEGQLQAGDYSALLAEKPVLVSIMAANNETGVLQDVIGLAPEARKVGAVFHTDAVQTFGKTPIDFRVLNAAGVYALTLSAHKIGGPKGAGVLVVDKRLELEPLIAGGGHERGLRSGTENVAAIVGFGAACELVAERLAVTQRLLSGLRDALEDGLLSMGATLFGAGAERLPNTTYFSFPNIDGETLVGQLDRAGYSVASGAACSSANPDPSHVLSAMGIEPGLARGAVRVSLGVGNNSQHVQGFLDTLRETVAKLRGMTALVA